VPVGLRVWRHADHTSPGRRPSWQPGCRPYPRIRLDCTVVTLREIGERTQRCKDWQYSSATWQDCIPPRLSTFPQPRLSTARRRLTSEFTRIIHRSMHRALSWLVTGRRYA
jgi:hypothetical protein